LKWRAENGYECSWRLRHIQQNHFLKRGYIMRKKFQWVATITISLVTIGMGRSAAQTWSQLSPSGTLPNSTAFNTTAFNATNNILLSVLPEGGSVPEQVWTLSNGNGLTGTPAWTELTPTGTAPGSNGGSSGVYIAVTDQMVMYGGCFANCSPALDGVFVLNNASGVGGTPSWSQSSPNTSIPRTGQTAVYDPTRNVMITFGGDTAFFGTDHNDTNILSPANGPSPTWTTLTTAGGPPPVRDSAVAVYDVKHNVMILFGGQQIFSPTNIPGLNDVWVLTHANGHGGTPTWTNLVPAGTPPLGRSNCGAVYDSDANALYIFGGVARAADQTTIALGDVWKLTDANGQGNATPTWKQVGQRGTPPGGTIVPGVAFDEANRRLISFGGEDRNSAVFFQTFILDLTVK
jgi:hypothetical protein